MPGHFWVSAADKEKLSLEVICIDLVCFALTFFKQIRFQKANLFNKITRDNFYLQSHFRSVQRFEKQALNFKKLQSRYQHEKTYLNFEFV